MSLGSMGAIGLENLHNPRIPGLVISKLQHEAGMSGLSASGFFSGTESRSIIKGWGMPSSETILDMSGFKNTEKAVAFVVDQVRQLNLLA